MRKKRKAKGQPDYLQGSRVRRDMYRKKLTRLLEKADDEAFFRMAWATLMLQSGRPEKARPFLMFPPEAATTDISSRFTIHTWTIETMLNELLTTPKLSLLPDHPNRRLDCRQFGAIVAVSNALKGLENAEDGLTLRRVNVLRELHRLAQRQFEWQRGFVTYSQLYRAAFIYGGDLTANYFADANKLTMNDFSLACFALYATYLDKPVFLRDGNLGAVGISNDARDAVFDSISISHAEARAKASELRSGGGHTAYKRSLFRLYPCVAFGDNAKRVLTPLPELLILRATSGLFYDVITGGDQVRNEISGRFQQYCQEFIQSMLPSYIVKGSYQYRFRKNLIDTPDVLLYDKDMISLIFECKATRMSYEARFSDDPIADARRGYEEMAKGVLQIWRFVSHNRRGVLQQERQRSDVKGIILTLDTWLSMANEMQLDVLKLAREMAAAKDPCITIDDQIPVTFCPVNDLEQTLGMATEVSFLKTVDAATEERFQGWHLWSVHEDIAPNIKEAREYPFMHRVADVLPWAGRFGFKAHD